MTDGAPRIEYVEARRGLLDALTALQPHIGAVVLIGAQAVYLRTAERFPTYPAFTTNADLVVGDTVATVMTGYARELIELTGS